MLDGNQDTLMQRSRGAARVALDLHGGQVRLRDLHQSGSAKALLPRVSGRVPEVVFLNTSGGLTGGDRLDYRLDIGAGARVSATTQTAERGYASTGDAATLSVAATVGAGGHLDWLPQETLLYEHAHLRRSTVIDLAADAGCLVAESVVLGRHAMGETPAKAHLHDHRMIRRMDRPVWAETLALDPETLAAAANPAILGQARALAVVALVTQGAADAVTALRAVLTEPGCEAAASGWDGKCVLRIVARDGWPLKRQMARALAVLTGRPLPRVWQIGDLP